MEKILLGIITIFLLIPYLLDKFLMGKITTTMGINEWFGFLGSYLGGGIAALITLYGIYWQLFTTKEKDKKGIIKFIKYKFIKNINIKFPYDIFYNRDDLNNTKVISNFNNNFLEQNINLIFSLNKGPEIAEIIDDIDKYNKLYLEYADNYINNPERFKFLFEFMDKSKLDIKIANIWKEIISIWDNTSKLLLMNIFKIDRYLKNNDKVSASSSEAVNRAFNNNLRRLESKLSALFGANYKNQLPKISNDYLELQEVNYADKNNFTSQDFENYLIKLFNLEKDLFKESVLLLADVDLSQEYSEYYFNECIKYINFMDLKINLLIERKIILEKIKKILEEENELKKVEL